MRDVSKTDMNKKAFTMIELVFVIVVLGILAGVAIPRLAVTRDDATVAKIRADLASIRSGIALDKSKAMMEGRLGEWKKEANIKKLADNGFSSVVQGGVKKGNARNGWKISKDKETEKTTIEACVAGKCATFRLVAKDDATKNEKAGDFICEGKNCNLFE